jgi:enoyl-CoA hydratase/carnithine racemase
MSAAEASRLPEPSPTLFEVDDDGVATLTLNRPHRRNAIDAGLLAGCVDGLRRAHVDDDVRVVLVTGAGSAFCAGGDVDAFGHEMTPSEQKRFLFETVFEVARTLEVIDKPVIAMVNGHAMGAGLDLALMCDLRFAAEDAKLGEAYIKVGVAPGDGGAWLLPRLVGTARALDLLWTGRAVSGTEAAAMGMVNAAFPADRLEHETRRYARALAHGPLEAIRVTKRAVYQAAQVDLRTHVDLMSSHMAVLRASPDFAEGVAALREGRPPHFGVGRDRNEPGPRGNERQEGGAR